MPDVESHGLEDEVKLLQAGQNIAFLRSVSAYHGPLRNRLKGIDASSSCAQCERHYPHGRIPAAAITLLAGLVDRIQSSSEYSTNLLDCIHEIPDLTVGYYEPKL